ncbi:MAG: hypothetical protein IT429_25620 [Gemmataceae bacterium]|nr:hypothetical protein [Gemmataceae bacterium]
MSISPDDPAVFTASLIGTLTRRLDDASARGTLTLTFQQYVVLLEVLFPEQYQAPPQPDAACLQSLPGTPARAAVFHMRSRAGQSLRHPDDLCWPEDLARDPVSRRALALTGGATLPQEPPALDLGGRFLWRVHLDDGRSFEVWADNKTQAKERCREKLGCKFGNSVKVRFERIGERDGAAG